MNTEAYSEIKAPWVRFYGKVPAHLDYPEGSMMDAVTAVAEQYPDQAAYTFQGVKTTYRELVEQTHRVARAFAAAGVRKDDRVTVCLPNCPQAVLCFYGLNLIGAVATMIHPLSSVGEIAFYLRDSESKVAVTLDQFYGKFQDVMKEQPLDKLIIATIGDALTPVLRAGYWLTQGRKLQVPEIVAPAEKWRTFLKNGDAYEQPYLVKRKAEEPAAILFSGGTTGVTKGILLSNLNFNALGLQTIAMATTFEPGQRMLAAMPMFHGFGLGV